MPLAQTLLASLAAKIMRRYPLAPQSEKYSNTSQVPDPLWAIGLFNHGIFFARPLHRNGVGSGPRYYS